MILPDDNTDTTIIAINGATYIFHSYTKTFSTAQIQNPDFQININKKNYLNYRGSFLHQEFTQVGSMAVVFVLAITTNRKIGFLGKCSKKSKVMVVFRNGHFASIIRCKGCPLGWSGCGLAKGYGFGAWRKVWVPDVVPVLGGTSRLGNTPWRTAYRANALSFAIKARVTRPDNADSNELFLNCLFFYIC